MNFNYIAGIAFVIIGVALQFLFGVSGLGSFFGSLCVFLAPLLIPPTSSSSAEMVFANNYTYSDEQKSITVDKPFSEVISSIVSSRSANEELSGVKSQGILKVIMVMRIIGICLGILMCLCALGGYPQEGAILADLVFIPYFIFKCRYDWPVDIYSPYENTDVIDKDVVIPIDEKNPDNPYFGFQCRLDLVRRGGHACVDKISPRFTLKKEIPHLLCAQLQVAKNNVRCTEYPYAYFVMVYPEDKADYVKSLQARTNDFIKSKQYRFKAENKHDKGNVILIVRLSDGVNPAYFTNESDCQQLSDIILIMLKIASTAR